jgi:hypothetical protein
MGIDTDPELLRVFTDVHRHPEGLGRAFGFLDGMVNPAIPGTVRSDQNQLRVVQADADDHCLCPLPVQADVVARALDAAGPACGFGCVLEGPCAFHVRLSSHRVSTESSPGDARMGGMERRLALLVVTVAVLIALYFGPFRVPTPLRGDP